MFIDYKSLGVRQLGSIYEGLLEFRIRIAQETMAVVKGKKTEEVISYAEAERNGRRVLKKGRGRDAEERVYAPGKVYLENDRRERKASGSYYTPDHIVKYIVENTVGPVLEQKLEKLRPRLRDAQQAYGKALVRAKSLERQGLKPDDPAKVAGDYTDVVDGLFDLKVLDPAMGSGHFLVEAVDFICDRILGQREGFLRAFPWNPVTRYLDDTREAIKAEMEKQGVVVDAGRLTDVNLLKRHVLKRCAYGVDLNPMAVELAKVSLWLDCFTVGAPLSFLDHHLKCGNSLIGTTVQEVESELAEQAKGFVGDLFGGPFQGLLSGYRHHRGACAASRTPPSSRPSAAAAFRRVRKGPGALQVRARHLGQPALWQQARPRVPHHGGYKSCGPNALRWRWSPANLPQRNLPQPARLPVKSASSTGTSSSPKRSST